MCKGDMRSIWLSHNGIPCENIALAFWVFMETKTYCTCLKRTRDSDSYTNIEGRVSNPNQYLKHLILS